jgi:hypothetical protein
MGDTEAANSAWDFALGLGTRRWGISQLERRE